MSKKLDRMKSQKAQAEQKLRYYQHQEKMLEHRIPELTSKAAKPELIASAPAGECWRAS